MTQLSATTPGAAWNRVAVTVLPVVVTIGAVLSWGSLYEAAAVILGAHAPRVGGVNLVGAAFPLLVDALILGASARYVAGVKAARPVGGWRAAAHAAHAGVAGTIALNAAASPTLAAVPWHVTAPIVWSVLVELLARDVLGELAAAHTPTATGTGRGRIPARLWVTAPAESVRISWRMARTGQGDPEVLRAATERCAAARDHLAAVHPGPGAWRMRRQITRRLWTGALDPAALARLVETHPTDPAALHRAVLHAITTPERSRPTGPARDRTGPTSPPAPEPDEVPGRDPDPDPRPRPGQFSGPEAVSSRESTDLTRVIQAAENGDLAGRVTKARIREHLRCSNPHAGAINALYQNHLRRTGQPGTNGQDSETPAVPTPVTALHEVSR